MEKKRLFVAIDLPPVVIEQIKMIQQQLARRHLFEGRFTHEEHLHLTLKFIGEVDEPTHQQVQQALRELNFPRIQTALGKLGLFVADKEVAIVWVALQGEEFGALAHAINEILSSFLPYDTREFVSHVTIARVKSVPDEEKLRAYVAETLIDARPFEVTEFVLKDSVLSDAGPYYTVRERYPLSRLV